MLVGALEVCLRVGTERCQPARASSRSWEGSGEGAGVAMEIFRGGVGGSGRQTEAAIGVCGMGAVCALQLYEYQF